MPAHLIELAHNCLKNTYFRFNGKLYRQTEGAPMGSALSPVISILFIGYFETKALNDPFRPKRWLR